MNTFKIKKLEYFRDIFKGTCELNNYECTKIGVLENLEALLKEATTEDIKKSYFYGYPKREESEMILGSIMLEPQNNHRICEFVNMANKILYNAGIYETTILVDTEDKEIIDMLDMLDLVATQEKVQSKKFDKDFAFEIQVGDSTAIFGGKLDKAYYFYIDYRALEDLIDYDEKDVLNVYMMPQTKNVLDDAIVIATNLKDAGFKVEIDYELSKIVPDAVDIDFLITLDENAIKEYKVNLKDLKTQEEREIMIDNLIEELSFI